MNQETPSPYSRHALLIFLPSTPWPLWGAYGSFSALTPHLDLVASEGVTLDRCLLASETLLISSPDSKDWQIPWDNFQPCEVAIPPEAIPALESAEEFEEEILDQILELILPAKKSLTIVHLPNIPLHFLPDPLAESSDEESNENSAGGEESVEDADPNLDDEAEQEEALPENFPHDLLPFETLIDWERIVVWQDRFVAALIDEWRDRIPSEGQELIVLTSRRSNSYPFEASPSIEPDLPEVLLETTYRLPCILWESSKSFAGLRIPAPVSILGLSATLSEWLSIPQTELQPLAPSWWLLIRGECDNLHTVLRSTTPLGTELIWLEEGLLIRHPEHPPRLFFKPEDAWDLDNIAPEQPRLLERILEELEGK